MKNIILVFSVLIAIIFTSCETPSSNGPSISKKEVAIGGQVWMSENLNVDTFRNGEPIPEARSDQEWRKASEEGMPVWCFFANDPINGEKYGKLYNWYAINDARGLAPTGWRIPTERDWTILINYLGGLDLAGKKLKSTEGWSNNGNGTNESGFTALPGGARIYDNGVSPFLLGFGYWWSSTDINVSIAWSLSLNPLDDLVQTMNYPKANGLSIRCIKN
jgi:uncharacterized protein (TIGR02145 family)